MEARDFIPERLRRYEQRRRWLFLFTSVLGALLFIQLFARLSIELSGFLIEVAVRLESTPQTRVLIPPIGEIRANTHSSLSSLEVVLWNIDMDIVRDLIFPDSSPLDGAGPGSPAASLADIEGLVSSSVQHVAQQLVLLVGALGFLGGSLGSLLGGAPRTVRRWLGGGLLGFVIALGLLFPAYVTYDTNAFSTAEYRGIIQTAPWMVEAVRESVGQVEALGSQLQTIAGNLYTLFERLDQLDTVGLPPADLIVLHVSDLHNNFAALSFVDAVARRFNVDFVIDTGDITDWGTPLEADLIERIGALQRPYVFIPGNHESPLVLQRLRNIPNVRVLENELISIMGLRMFGFTDPGAYVPSPRHLSPQEAAALSDEIASTIQSLPPNSVDLIAVHNHRVARSLPDGLAQAVLFGHDHRMAIDTSRRTVLINAGTTGAAGIRGLQTADSVPYSLVILYFSRPDTAPFRPLSPAEVRENGTVANSDHPSGPDNKADSDEPLPPRRENGSDYSLRLAALDTVRVFTLPAHGLSLERMIINPQDLP